MWLVLLHAHVRELQVKGIQHSLCVGIDGDVVDGDGGYLWHEVHAALTLLLLKLQGDTTDWATLDAAHQVLKHDGEVVHNFGVTDDLQ